MSGTAALDTPMMVQAIDGEVVVLGPLGMALSLTFQAADESARRLAVVAAEARRQSPSLDLDVE